MTTVTDLTVWTRHSRDDVLELLEELAVHDGRAAVIVSEGAGDTVVTTRAENAVLLALHP